MGATVVLNLAENLRKGSTLFFDNYFTSYPLLEILKNEQINAIATVRINQFCNPPLISDKNLKSKERGYSDEVISADKKVYLRNG